MTFLRDTYFLCTADLYIASILSNGNIFICPDVERRKEFIQGNIKTDNFVDVWETNLKFLEQKIEQSVVNVQIVQIGNIVWWILFTHLILMKEGLIFV